MAAATQVVKFLAFDAGDSTTSEAFLISVTNTIIETGTLSQLRTTLGASSQSREYAANAFCSDKGTVMPDSFNVQEYLKNAISPAVKTAETPAAPTTPAAPLSFYVKKAAPKTAPPKAVAQPIDTTVVKAPDAVTTQPLPTAPTSTYDASTNQASSSDDPVHPSDLDQTAWGIIARNNSLFNGYNVDRVDSHGDIVAAGISVARRPAFRYKRRNIANYLLPKATVETDTTDTDAYTAVRIPNYVVDDRSYVSVYETKTSFQSSLADSNFSQVDVQASVEGGYGGISAAVSAGYANNSASSSATAKRTDSDRMNISFNYPRVTLVLDSESMEFTPDCWAMVQQIMALPDPTKDSTGKYVTDPAAQKLLQRFMMLYGEYFTTIVQVGGRLYASNESSTVAGSSAASKEQSMKVAASVSVNSMYGGGSVSASYGEGSKSTVNNQSSSFVSNLTWQASGGNTLLCNNPAAWIDTVGPYEHWRTISQTGVLHIADLIDEFDGASGFANKFSLQFNGVGGSTTSDAVSKLDTFRLEATGPGFSHTTPNQFLTMCSPSNWTAAAAMKYSADNFQKEPGAKDKYISAQRGSEGVGAVVARAQAADSTQQGQLFYAEDELRRPVEKLRYNTFYRIKNRATGFQLVYSDTDAGFGIPRTGTGDFEPFIMFRDTRNTQNASNTDEIGSDARVQISFYRNAMNGTPERGYMWLTDENQKDPQKMIYIVEKGANYRAQFWVKRDTSTSTTGTQPTVTQTTGAPGLTKKA